ncbi:peptide chain release factor 1 [Blochmannia endosymbiont of Camponotus sp. C-003]|uniref:peptide chain release factor 1 n=1 Tax=unclassified Candidatus Blochmanniella TaxID=711328 RepID=UPI00202437D9|nr:MULTISPECIES: peptide chain release factor 1 [unclassified Candidatus Blochmannia]URJ23465.1 peptide chain release factor 1 [Blochmannia endosymbiont of Camponotus sp. C-003]URJ28937.1 peptide chain release factor 1 [Blochmannia endosymbiont of Camponotus sp. C-046]
MNPVIVNKLIALQERFNILEKLLNKPNIINDKKHFRTLSKEHARLSEIVIHFKRWLNIKQEITNTKKMLDDIDMHDIAQDELKTFYLNQYNLEQNLKILLLPIDPNDQLGCFIELRAGTGGKEAAIFAGELFRMYARYAEVHRWKMEIINVAYGECGGYKEIIAKIPYKGAYSFLKFESGGHRVQRVPHTESQGRIHTSTCTIAVIPEIPDIELPSIDPHDLRIDTFRSSGAGGQHVNTTDSAIRITHIPSGLVVECQDERSQHKNKAKALSVLGSRLHAIEMKRRQQEVSCTRRNLLGTGDRSDRIRTYNFQQGRITDHRISFTSYKLNDIMNGELNILIQPIINQYQSDQLNKLLELK